MLDVSWFIHKKIVVMGLGLHGGGVALVKWLYTQGAEVIVTDLKSYDELRQSREKVNSFCLEYKLSHPNGDFIFPQYHLGGHQESDFTTCDCVIQNPGVPRESPYLALAREHSIPIENEATLFFLLTRATPKIGVTGTRGKSTTTALIGHILRTGNPATLVAGIATQKGVVSFFDIIDSVLSFERRGVSIPVVLELSSWQLEPFSQHVDLAPSVAVITNILPDHLNRYTDFNAYADAKKLLAEHQTRDDFLILNYDNATTLQIGLKGTKARRYWFTRQEVSTLDRGAFLKKHNGEDCIFFKDDEKSEEIAKRASCSLRGNHSTENILAAVAATKVWGVPTENIQEGLSTFVGISDRQEKIASFCGREWYNDTTSTTPHALVAALQTLGNHDNRSLVLIAGGADKKLDFNLIAAPVKRYVRSLIFLSGSASPRMITAVADGGFDGHISLANSMEEAVYKAWNESKDGDILLLSPGAASFGMFVHEFDRGEQYVSAVRRLQEKMKINE